MSSVPHQDYLRRPRVSDVANTVRRWKEQRKPLTTVTLPPSAEEPNLGFTNESIILAIKDSEGAILSRFLTILT